MNITGEQIKEARERLHMTQGEFADELGVSLRTVGSWERGESVPRSRMGAIREVLKLERPDDNREGLSRLIQEELEASGRGPTGVTKDWTLSLRRSFYTWKDGTATPTSRNRALLEDSLGWRRGSVTEVLTAPITKDFTLSEVRDWSKSAPQVVYRARDLSTHELLAELTARFRNMEDEVEALRAATEAQSNVVPLRDSQDMYDVAASSQAEGRNMEHLEDRGDSRR